MAPRATQAAPNSQRCMWVHNCCVASRLPLPPLACFMGSEGKLPTHAACRYGTKFDRTSVCYNTSTSLLVRVVDSCEPLRAETHTLSGARQCSAPLPQAA